MEKIQLVVARYNEDINWTKEFPNVIIYNKSSETTGAAIEISLPNIGREGHTFYKHIYDNYDNLCDYTVFLQGDPFPHYKNMLEKLRACAPAPAGFEILSDWIIHSTVMEQKQKYGECEHITETYKKIFGIELKDGEDTECIFGSGGQFAVSKNIILRNSRCFYENIVNILSSGSDPREGYHIERLHKYIINGPAPIVREMKSISPTVKKHMNLLFT